MNNKKILNMCVYVFIIFLILFPCYIVTITNSNTIDDASNFILNALNSFSENKWYIENNFDHRARMSIMLIDFLPINISYFIFKIKSLKILVHIYAFILFFIPILLCAYSCYLFKRNNIGYMSIFPLLLLIIGVFPVFPYGCVEAYISVFIFFILFQYFLINMRFSKIDYFIFVLLCIAIMNAHESILLFAPILWITYGKFSNKNNKILKWGGVTSTIISFIIYICFAVNIIPPHILCDNGLHSSYVCFIPGLYIFNIDSMINFHLLFYFLTLINILNILFNNKNKYLNIILPFICLILFCITYQHLYLYLYKIYRFVCIYLLIGISLFIICKYNNKLYLQEITKKSLPFIITSLLICNIYIIDYSSKYDNFMKQLVISSKKPIFYFKDDIESYKTDFFENNINNLNNHISQLAYSIIAINSQKNKNNTKGIIYAYDNNSLKINKEPNRINVDVGALNINIKNEFWDITPFINNIE